MSPGPLFSVGFAKIGWGAVPMELRPSEKTCRLIHSDCRDIKDPGRVPGKRLAEPPLPPGTDRSNYRCVIAFWKGVG